MKQIHERKAPLPRDVQQGRGVKFQFLIMLGGIRQRRRELLMTDRAENHKPYRPIFLQNINQAIQVLLELWQFRFAAK